MIRYRVDYYQYDENNNSVRHRHLFNDDAIIEMLMFIGELLKDENLIINSIKISVIKNGEK